MNNNIIEKDGKKYEEFINNDKDIINIVTVLTGQAKLDNKLYYINHDGHILYSDTVTLDGAYKEITGMTFREYVTNIHCSLSDISSISVRNKVIKDREEYRTITYPKLVKEFLEKSKDVISEDKFNNWETMVKDILRDKSYGKLVVRDTLEIVKLLNEDKFDEAIDFVHEKVLSGTVLIQICNIITEVSDKGIKFVEMINNY